MESKDDLIKRRNELLEKMEWVERRMKLLGSEAFHSELQKWLHEGRNPEDIASFIELGQRLFPQD